MKNRLIVPVFVVLAMFGAACGSSDDESVPADADPTAAPAEAPEPDESVDAGDDADPPDVPIDEPDQPDPQDEAVDETAQVVFATFVGGGFTVVDVALSEFPQLVIMSDGITYRSQSDFVDFPTPLTPAIERLRLNANELASVAATVSAAVVLVSGANFDLPTVADAPSTTVWALVDSQLVSVNATALGFDDPSTNAPDLDARASLQALIDEINVIVNAADPGEVTEPPFLGVLAFPGLGFEENAVSLDWPITTVPAPVGGGTECVVLEGEDLTAVWALARDATTQTPWVIDGETKALAFRPVFAHEDFC